ncbi:MAG: hypothetical protein M3436_00755 [Pseudomonadota bacterium]|nr:hypothetical protein [Pseudomonadota bacterium]
MNEILENFPRTVAALGSLMDEFRESATENPRLILRELDESRDDEIREKIIELARDAVDYPPISAWYREILDRASLRYAQRRIKEIENETREDKT